MGLEHKSIAATIVLPIHSLMRIECGLYQIVYGNTEIRPVHNASENIAYLILYQVFIVMFLCLQ